jgi:nucleoside-diphosphate-sugar epimerase
MVRDQVIVGSGLIATAFGRVRGLRGTVFHAAGVSDSTCTRESEFARDRDRLRDSLLKPGLFIYVSTCSVEDKPYAHHKRAMEEMVRQRGDYLVVRLPIVAGRTSNPHTLLNYLFSRIQRSEGFDLFARARRNVIDVEDAAGITGWLIRNGAHNETVNVAAPKDYPVTEIVKDFEIITNKKAFATIVDAGDSQDIDVRRIADADVDFSGDYLGRTLARYYK